MLQGPSLHFNCGTTALNRKGHFLSLLFSLIYFNCRSADQEAKLQTTSLNGFFSGVPLWYLPSDQCWRLDHHSQHVACEWRCCRWTSSTRSDAGVETLWHVAARCDTSLRLLGSSSPACTPFASLCFDLSDPALTHQSTRFNIRPEWKNMWVDEATDIVSFHNNSNNKSIIWFITTTWRLSLASCISVSTLEYHPVVVSPSVSQQDVFSLVFFLFRVCSCEKYLDC